MKRIHTIAGTFLLLWFLGLPIVAIIVMSVTNSVRATPFIIVGLFISYGICAICTAYLNRWANKRFPAGIPTITARPAVIAVKKEQQKKMRDPYEMIFLNEDQVKFQVEQYDKLKKWETARGKAVLATVFVTVVGEVFTVFSGNFPGFDFWYFFPILLYGFLAINVYRGKKWANITLLIVWTLDKALQLKFSPANFSPIILWWFFIGVFFLQSYQVEKARPVSSVKRSNSWLSRGISTSFWVVLFLLLQLMLTGLLEKIPVSLNARDFKYFEAVLYLETFLGLAATSLIFIKKLTKDFSIIAGISCTIWILVISIATISASGLENLNIRFILIMACISLITPIGTHKVMAEWLRRKLPKVN